MSKDNNLVLFARIRQNDDLLREYFTKIKPNDRAYEIRRLLEKAIKIEQEEKRMIEELRKNQEKIEN